jgi:hypothetical protein
VGPCWIGVGRCLIGAGLCLIGARAALCGRQVDGDLARAAGQIARGQAPAMGQRQRARDGHEHGRA